MTIWQMPVEFTDPSAFSEETTHQSYEAKCLRRFWHVLLQTTRVFNVFRARFTGKVSQVHLFWGALDLACDNTA